MASKPYKLPAHQQEKIPDLVNEKGADEASRYLNVSLSYVSRWLKNNGYKKRVVWEKELKQA